MGIPDAVWASCCCLAQHWPLWSFAEWTGRLKSLPFSVHLSLCVSLSLLFSIYVSVSSFLPCSIFQVDNNKHMLKEKVTWIYRSLWSHLAFLFPFSQLHHILIFEISPCSGNLPGGSAAKSSCLPALTGTAVSQMSLLVSLLPRQWHKSPLILPKPSCYSTTQARGSILTAYKP